MQPGSPDLSLIYHLRVANRLHHVKKERRISELLSIITTPLAGENPFGVNINYDADFDILKNEVAKLGGIDYDMLEKTGVKILSTKSKDIRVMSFLSWVYLRSGNWENLADIWDGLGTLVEQNYDAIYPDRDRARQLAFKWLAEERFTVLLEQKKPTEADYEHITRLLAGLSKIKPVLEQKFPDGSPFPSELFKSVGQWERTCKPKPKVVPPPTSGDTAQSQPQNSGASAQTANPATAQQPPASIATTAAAAAEPMDTPKQAQGVVRKAALILIEKEPTKPSGYRLLRCVRWDLLEKAPPSDSGKTQLTGPSEQQRNYFQKLLAEKQWKTIIEKAESAFCSGGNHLWLDLQRLVAMACRELGTEYAAVHSAVLFETALLIARIPELTALNFSDGTPLCDEATKDWIMAEIPKTAGANGNVAAAESSNDQVDEERHKLNAVISSGKIDEALAILHEKITGSSVERDNFRRTVMAAELLIRAKQPDVAVSMLESLDNTLEERNLYKWDPAVAVSAWSALVAAYKAARSSKPQNVQIVIQEKLTTILGKISKIDPGKVLTLSK